VQAPTYRLFGDKEGLLDAVANGLGVVLSLIATPPAERDPELSTVAREHVLRTITTDRGGEPAATAIASRAVALREALRDSGTTRAVPDASRRRDGCDGQP